MKRKSLTAVDIILFTCLSCSSCYFLGTYWSGKSFDNPLTYVMLLAFVLGFLHLLDREEKK